jgi:hypothetical protein
LEVKAPKPERRDERNPLLEMQHRQQAAKQRALERLQQHRRVVPGVGKT